MYGGYAERLHRDSMGARPALAVLRASATATTVMVSTQGGTDAASGDAFSYPGTGT